MKNDLTYTVIRDPDGFIATCDSNAMISVSSKDESKLDDAIHAAAKLYAQKYPKDPHAILIKGKARLQRRN